MTYQKLLVGTDGSDTSLKAVAVAAEVAKENAAELTILYAHPEDDDAVEILRRAEGVARRAGLDEVRKVAQPGDPSETLISFAEGDGYDLLLVGNKGMAGVRRFMLGNVPNKVSHHAPCDVLIVKTN